MNQFSPQELDDKIQTFIKGKIKKYPELGNEQYYIDRTEPVKREGVSRQLFPAMHLGAQF